MNYLEALKIAHDILKPELYLEIGCRNGASLSLANCRSIAVDPDYEITAEIRAPTQIFRQTSDTFFASPASRQIIAGTVDLAFIDGMHNVEFALRDFVNLESHSDQSSVIVVDDVLPRDIAWATREREGQYWTGDIYRLLPILNEYRPDLEIKVFDIDIKGLAIITGLNPDNSILQECMDEIEAKIAMNEWVLHSTQDIRQMIRPYPAEQLDDHLSGLVRTREYSSDNLSIPDVIEMYLEIVKKAVLNELNIEDELRIFYLKKCIIENTDFDYGKLHNIGYEMPEEFEELWQSRQNGYFPQRKISNSGFSHTMIGRKRLDSLHQCLDHVRQCRISGDLIECGVWRGGASIFMAAYAAAFNMSNRRILVADSFEGLPEPSLPQDKRLDLSKNKFPELAISLETVKESFKRFGFNEGNVLFLKGWFKDTLPTAPVNDVALLRLDGDLYESTMDCMKALYDRVTKGGVVIIDDWGALEQCRQAVTDFFESRGEELPEIKTIDWTGVYWIKNE